MSLAIIIVETDRVLSMSGGELIVEGRVNGIQGEVWPYESYWRLRDRFDGHDWFRNRDLYLLYRRWRDDEFSTWRRDRLGDDLFDRLGNR